MKATLTGMKVRNKNSKILGTELSKYQINYGKGKQHRLQILELISDMHLRLKNKMEQNYTLKKKKKKGNSLDVQGLKLHSSAKDPIWIPGQGTEISTNCGSQTKNK